MSYKLFASSLITLTLLSALPVHAASPAPEQLIKLACPAHTSAGDPCTAVYYFGSDGKRHAFPNDKVYFTWYSDFSSVKTISPSAMASIPLGGNVTYQPGSRMVKFTTDNKVYAVALGGTLRWVKTENAATALYSVDWNKQVDDINDAFFSNYRMGADISTAADFNRDAEAAAARIIDNDLDSISRSMSVVTERGTFDISLIQLQRDRFTMQTDTASTSDCTNNCPVKSLDEYANTDGALAGIHGGYFCPPDYAGCAGKINTFLDPVFNSAQRVMLNASSLAVHEGPIIAQSTDGRYFFFHRTHDFGNSVSSFESKNGVTLGAALANYPSLVESGQLVVESETRLDDGQRTIKSARGAIGFNDRFVYLVIAKSATVVDLASIMKALGTTNALNLDGGGSAALWYSGAYTVGPGRDLPDVILFKAR